MYSRRLSALGMARNSLSKARSCWAELAVKPCSGVDGNFSLVACCWVGKANREKASIQKRAVTTYFIHPPRESPIIGQSVPHQELRAKGQRPIAWYVSSTL